MKINKLAVKFWPIVVYLLFCAFVIGAFIHYAPSWGLMDDSYNLGRAQTVFKGASVFTEIKKIIRSDLIGWGMFRPVYYTWAIFTYHIFRESPLAIYLLIALFNLLSFALWGYLLHFLFSGKKENRLLHIFLFPLIFSIFTPLWNIFIYISLQQKFIVTFSALAILYFFKAYAQKNKAYIFFSLLFVLLSIGTHPEGIFLVMAFIGCIVIDVVIKRRLSIISLINLVTYVFLFIAYFIFTLKVQMAGIYTARYKGGFNVSGILAGISGASIAVKGILGIAVIALVAAVLRALFKREIRLKASIVLPLGVISYILILAPWGFPNYHLSILAPFVMGIFFPLYMVMNKRSNALRNINNTLIIVLAFTACAYIAAPRIAKMGQIREVVQFLKKHRNANPESVYFTSPPLWEAGVALGHFSGAKVNYLRQGKLSYQDLHRTAGNYLIFSNESNALALDGVNIGRQIYANNTWRVFKVSGWGNYSSIFDVNFGRNFFQKLVVFLR